MAYVHQGRVPPRRSLSTAATGGSLLRQPIESPTRVKHIPAVSTAQPRVGTRLEQQQEDQPYSILSKDVREITQSRVFDIVIGVVIFFNAISIGIEQSLQVEGHSTTVIQVVESVFLSVYIFELSARLVGYGLDCFQDNWVKFDFFLILIGVLNTWVLEPALEDSPDALGLLMVLRVLRLLRLAKSARLLKRIQEFWRLIRGFLNSATIMLYTLLIVFLVLYVFSSLGVEVITKHRLSMGDRPDAEFRKVVDEYFSSLPQTMLTLVQFVTMDDMSLVYKPLIDKDPMLSVYFVMLMLVLSIVLMNLVAAVIFSSTLEQEQDEHDEIQRAQEEEWAKLIRDLKDMFIRLDVDQSGCLSRDEVLCMDPADRDILVKALDVTTPEKIFNALDVDRNGQVSINEFFDGIWDVVLAKGTVDLKRLEKQVETMHWRLKETFSIQHDLRLAMDRVVRTLDNLYDQGGGGDVRSNVTMSTGCSNVGSPRTSKVGATQISTIQLDMPEWARELTESMKQIMKDRSLPTKKSQRASCHVFYEETQETNQSDTKTFRDVLKEQRKGGTTAVPLDRSESLTTGNTGSTKQTNKEVNSITAESEQAQPSWPKTGNESTPRRSRMKRATEYTEEAKQLAARLTSTATNADGPLKHI